MLFLMLLNCLIPIFVSQENFRTILIERACQRRPSLNFCADFSTRQPSTSESKSEELLLPEEIKSIPQALITTSSNEMTSNTTPRISDVPSTSLSNVSTNSPIDEVNFDNLTQTEELLGSLLRLPKPEEDVATTGLTSMSTVGQPVFPENTSITPTSIEDEVSGP
ncbi:hypothetical protein DICVIV_03516 [Dictyocaulus viviparus]|uniref:Uncharacterized protein n=1 Tax=Dictyocaulus viviparus TaxID=29172 RepID=A0A0D8Y0D9_DICVI|nr:hypothetical protein DICVIV_03516 [Dictyocaulus viviparus]